MHKQTRAQVGHTGFNTLLRYLSSLSISLAIQLEPLFGALIGWALSVSGAPGAGTWAGGAVVLAATLVVLAASSRRQAAEAAAAAAARRGGKRGDGSAPGGGGLDGGGAGGDAEGGVLRFDPDPGGSCRDRETEMEAVSLLQPERSVR